MGRNGGRIFSVLREIREHFPIGRSFAGFSHQGIPQATGAASAHRCVTGSIDVEGVSRDGVPLYAETGVIMA